MSTFTCTAARPSAEARIVAFFRDGTSLWIRRGRSSEKYTPHKQWSRVTSREAAEETVARLHAVQAGGVYWQEVAYFAVVPAAPSKTRKAR